jgi:hypothetical protein
MAKITDRQHSSRQYSITNLWIGLIAALLLLAIFLESVCLGILYINDALKGRDTSAFAKSYLLTRLLVSTSPNPIPGKKFIGTLNTDSPEWAKWLVPDDLLGWHLGHSVSVFLRESLFITNDNGFIADVDDPPVVVQKSVDAYRVIVLGGSTVMGGGAPRPSQDIVGMLRKEVRVRGLTGRNGKRVEFINAGVAGYNLA